MKYILHVNNLNNSIRFYNRLLGERPVMLTYDYARYKSDLHQVELELFESAEGNSSRGFDLSIPKASDYRYTFQQMKNFAASNPGLGCTVAEDYFVLTDPDANTWIVSKVELTKEQKDEIRKKNNCFLEPYK